MLLLLLFCSLVEKVFRLFLSSTPFSLVPLYEYAWMLNCVVVHLFSFVDLLSHFFLSQLCHWLNDLRLCICCTSDGCSFLLLFAFFFIFFAFVFIHFRYIHVRIHMFCTGMQDIGFGRWVNECSALYMYVEYKLGTLLSHILYLFARSIARCALCGIAPNRLYV